MTSSLFGGFCGLFSGVNVNFREGIPTPNVKGMVALKVIQNLPADFGFPSLTKPTCGTFWWPLMEEIPAIPTQDEDMRI